MQNTRYSAFNGFKITILFLVIALTLFSMPVNAKEDLPECDDGSVRMVKKVIDGKPFYALEPRLAGESGYGIIISSHKMDRETDKKGRVKEKLVPLSQNEFDRLLSEAKSYRTEKATLKRQAQWTGTITFVKTEHFDIEWDIPGMSIYKEGNKDQVECMLIYAERCEGMWKDAEAVFGKMDNTDINGPLKLCIHDTQSNTINTAKNLLGMQLNLGPVRGTYSYISVWYDKQFITDDQDLWETVTHNVAGAIVNQYKGLGRNQGSIPAWLDEGFAYYLTRIHRHLDKHTTKLFAESAEFGPKQIDGSTWKDLSKKMAKAVEDKHVRVIMEKALSSLSQEECILGWSIVAYLIEENIEKYKALFKSMDEDKSGYVSEEEFFEDKLRFDKDGDLELSEEEKAYGFSVFRSYDLNGDSKIDIVKEAVAHDFRKFIEIQKQGGSEKASTVEQALQKTFGWTLGELFDRWRAWLDGRKYQTADMPDLSVDSWSKFKKNLKQAMEMEDPVKRARAIMNLARFDTVDAAYVLYTILEDIETQIERKNEERPLIIYTAAQKVVSLWKSGGLKSVLQMADEGKCDKKKAENVTVRSYLLLGVADCPTHDRINSFVAKLLKNEEFAIRVAALDVLGQRGVSKGADKHWKEVLECMNDEVRAVKIAAVQALAKLANRNDTDQFIKIVDTLVEAMYKADGVIKDYLYKALLEITGEDFGPSYHSYKRWVQLYKKALKEGNANPQPNLGGGGEGGHKTDEAPPTYMGEKIFSKQIIFVIDRSYSMMEKIENINELKREITRGKKKSERTGGDDDDDEEEEEGIDWSKVKVKWDLARETLLKTVRSLKEEHKFTVILFDHRVWVWSTKMVPATDENKKKIEEFLVNQPPADSEGDRHWGRTNIFDALAVGFALTVGERVTNKQDKKPAKTGEATEEMVEKGAELINLLTDGAPTDGKYRNTEDILMRILEINRTRKVKINTFGIGKGHNTELLQELAEQNNGSYHNLTKAGG